MLTIQRPESATMHSCGWDAKTVFEIIPRQRRARNDEINVVEGIANCSRSQSCCIAVHVDISTPGHQNTRNVTAQSGGQPVRKHLLTADELRSHPSNDLRNAARVGEPWGDERSVRCLGAHRCDVSSPLKSR